MVLAAALRAQPLRLAKPDYNGNAGCVCRIGS